MALAEEGGCEQSAALKVSQLKTKAKSISVYRVGKAYMEVYFPAALLHGREKHWLTYTRTRHKSILQWKDALGAS